MDTAVTLRPEQRDAWLDEIAAAEPRVAPLLRKLLSAHRRVETNDMLATLPRPDRQPQHQPNGEIGAQIGPFELIELLGRGGMGSVWRARYADGRLKRDVAVKLPATTDNPAALASLRERFARERDFLAQLEHPNIARLYDTGFSDTGQPYLAMEFVAGEPIDTYCDTHRLTIKARLTLYLQVLDAVEFAHRQLVLHRDLKPGNVLVDSNGQARLLDFGVAKLLPETGVTVAPATSISTGTDLTEMAGAAITLAYAAPEQINNGRLSTATDVYALGVMLYRLLTGSAPYQPKRDTRGALEDEVLTVNPANASTRFASIETLAARQTNEVALRRTLAGDIDTILAKALKKNANDRYPTVAALAEDLRRNLAQQPIHARPDSAWYRGSRFVARHRIAVAASLLGVTALLATTGVAVWQAQIATASAARANKETKRANTAQKFLAGLFASADPEKSKTSTEFAKQVLERGLATAERELADDPEAHALVLKQIGDIYFRLGLPDEYLRVVRRRVAVLEAFPAAEINSLVDARLAVGQALGDSSVASDRPLALPHLEETQRLAETRHASTAQRIWALALLADDHRSNRRLDLARSYADRARALADVELPDPHPMLAAAHHAVAAVARDQGRFTDARAAFKKALAIDATGSGRGNVDQAGTLVDLANVEYDSGDYLAAKDTAIRVIEFSEREMGESAINMAAAHRLAVFAAERAGQFDEAQRLADKYLASDLAAPQPTRAGAAHMALGRVAMSRGDLTSAEKALLRARELLTGNTLWTGRTAALQAELELRKGQPQSAIALLSPIRERQLAAFGPDSTELAATDEWLGVSLARSGNRLLANSSMTNSCRLRARNRSDEHPQRIRCEAYRMLLSDVGDVEWQVKSLRTLEEKLTAGRRDQIPLVESLRIARTNIGSKNMTGSSLFLILN